jgi:hypothetical protein
MACGANLWDVLRHVRAGNVIVCERCLGVMSVALASGSGSGRIEVVIPPQVSGPIPDVDAVAAVVDSFLRTFGGHDEGDDRTDVMEDADELSPLLDHAGRTFGANLDPKTVIDRVRFPEPDVAKVRFRVLLRGSPDRMKFEGRAVKRRRRRLVTRSTVLSVLPGGGAMGMGATFVGAGATAMRNALTLQAQPRAATVRYFRPRHHDFWRREAAISISVSCEGTRFPLATTNARSPQDVVVATTVAGCERSSGSARSMSQAGRPSTVQRRTCAARIDA